MTTTTELLPIIEQEALDRCEAIIARGVQTFIDVGEALAEIRDAKLYRTHYDTWEEYCTDRWGIGRARAYQLITAAAVTREMSTVVDNPPTNEREARAIAKAAPVDRPKVIERATELAGDQPRTAKHIEQAAAEIAPPAEADYPPDFAIVKRRLAAHSVALLSNMQGHHRAFVTRKEGMTGVVTFDWADVLSKLERLEAEPPSKESDVAFRLTCPTCGETIMNGRWGDLKECGSCYHARQRTPAPVPVAPAGWICDQCGKTITDMRKPSMRLICTSCAMQNDLTRPVHPPAVPPRPRRPISADVSAQIAYIGQLETYASALEAFIMELQRQRP